MGSSASARRRALHVGLLCGGLSAAAGISAQTTAEQAALINPWPASSQIGTREPTPNCEAISDIVVTARSRNGRLQDAPLSVSAFNEATLQNSVLVDVQSVQKFLPNVQLSRVAFVGNALGVSIRGVSFADPEKTSDPAIGVAIDGVFLGTSTGADVDFNYIESIEVLRGPQGTLYGRNTNRDTIRAYGTLHASVAFIHSGATLNNLRIAASTRDFLHGGGRLSNTLDAGVFYFAAVVPAGNSASKQW